jgi:hypothetical protein
MAKSTIKELSELSMVESAKSIPCSTAAKDWLRLNQLIRSNPTHTKFGASSNREFPNAFNAKTSALWCHCSISICQDSKATDSTAEGGLMTFSWACMFDR